MFIKCRFDTNQSYKNQMSKNCFWSLNFDQAKEESTKYTESTLTEALVSLEESKLLDSGEIIKVITKEKLGEFLTTFGDVLTEDDIKAGVVSLRKLNFFKF